MCAKPVFVEVIEDLGRHCASHMLVRHTRSIWIPCLHRLIWNMWWSKDQ